MFELLKYPFFTNALAGLAIISVASAIIGTYIVTRRLVSLSGGVTHACFGGLGLGYYFGISPIFMAALFAIASSMGVELMSTRGRIREDSATAVVWALGMAVGILFVFLTPGYVPELNSFLFGNVLTIASGDLWTFGIFTVVLLVFFSLFYNKIVLCAFDRDFAKVMHLPVRFINYSMTVLVAVCIVLTIRLVGVMLLMSMLTLPQIIAELFYRKFGEVMIASVIVSLVCCIGGLLLCTVIDVPCSALIVLGMCLLYSCLAIALPMIRNKRRV